MKAVIIDLETGGLDPERCAITEIAAVAFEEQGGQLVETEHIYRRVRPDSNLFVSGVAMEVQKVTPEELWSQHRASEGSAMDTLLNFLNDNLTSNPEEWTGLIWAHNAPFDHGFLRYAEERFFRDDEAVFFPARCNWSCTKVLATTLHGMRKLPPLGEGKQFRVSLSSLATRLGISIVERERHDALYDARLTLQVLERLMQCAGWLKTGVSE